MQFTNTAWITLGLQCKIYFLIMVKVVAQNVVLLYFQLYLIYITSNDKEDQLTALLWVGLTQRHRNVVTRVIRSIDHNDTY